jgi:hypothetical protein
VRQFIETSQVLEAQIRCLESEALQNWNENAALFTPRRQEIPRIRLGAGHAFGPEPPIHSCS